MKNNKGRYISYLSKKVYRLKDKISCENKDRMYGKRRNISNKKTLHVTYAYNGRKKKTDCTIREIIINHIGTKQNAPKKAFLLYGLILAENMV